MIQRNINDDATLAYLFQKSGKEAGKAAGEVKAELDAFKAAFTDMVYPVGSIYMSVNSTSPEALFGGRWERITGRFLLGATDGGAAGGNSNASIAPGHTGGEASHVITAAEMASHTHNSRSLTGTIKNFAYQSSGTHATATGICSMLSNSETIGYATASQTKQADGVQINATHTHDSVGSNTAHNNMPPYLAVYVWKRTA
jgi:microcystin-dependent protein